MATNGKILYWEAYDFEVTSDIAHTASGAGSAIYSHNAEGKTNWCINSVNRYWDYPYLGIPDPVPELILLDVASSYDAGAGTASWSATYQGPGAPAGGYTLGAATFRNNVSIVLRLLNLKIYWNGNPGPYVSRLEWSGFELYINGALTGLGSSAYDSGALSPATGPQYMPVLGLPFIVSGSCDGDRDFTYGGLPVYDACAVDTTHYEWSSTVTQTISGGTRFKTGGVWYDLPVNPKIIEQPAAGGACDYGLDCSDIVVATATYGNLLKSTSYKTGYYGYVGREFSVFNATSSCYDPVTDTTINYTYTDAQKTCTDPCTGLATTHYHDVYKVETTNEHSSGSIWIVPDLTKTIHKMGKDYCALWYRTALPETWGVGTRSCVHGILTFSDNNIDIVYPATSEFLGRVTNATHAMEDVFARPTYAPCSASRSKERVVAYTYETPAFTACVCGIPDIVVCPPGWVTSRGCEDDYQELESGTFSESVSSLFPSAVDHMAGHYLQFYDPANPNDVEKATIRYFVSWCQPHWSYFHFWKDWNVDGNTYDTGRKYFIKRRQPWIYNSALPFIDQTRTRSNILCLDCLYSDTSFAPWYDAYVNDLAHGIYLSWIGASRWITREFDFRTGYTYTFASEPLWTLTDCTAVFGGASITVTTTGPSAIKLELKLGDWDYAPYMWPHIANKFLLDWGGADLASCKVYLKGADGKEVLLTDTPNVTTDRPTGAASKYAGAYAADNTLVWDDGSGGFITVLDQGDDFDADGMSNVTMSDPEEAHAFSLLPGKDSESLVFHITLVGGGTSCILKYPKLSYIPEADPQLVMQNGQVQSIVWKNGSALRFGSAWWNSIFVNNPPTVKGLTLSNTLMDMLAFGRLFIEGRAADGGLDAELATLYDSYEYTGRGSADGYSLSCILPKSDAVIATVDKLTLRAALVNTPAEVPPLCLFPVRERDGNWDSTGSYAQSTYSWTQNRNDSIAAGKNTITLAQPDLTLWSATLSGAHTGWSYSYTRHAVDNDENNYFWLFSNKKKGKTIRPWDGTFFVGGISGKLLDKSVGPFGFMNVITLDDENKLWWYSMYDWNTKKTQVTTDVKWAAVATNNALTVITILKNDGTFYEWRSGTERTLAPMADIEDFKSDCDHWLNVLVIYRDSTDNLHCVYQGNYVGPVGLLGQAGNYDVVYNNGRFVLTINTDGVLNSYYSYDMGATWGL